jgi:hypothetical protein
MLFEKKAVLLKIFKIRTDSIFTVLQIQKMNFMFALLIMDLLDHLHNFYD